MGMVEANSFTNIVPHKFKFASDYSGKVILPDFPSGDEQITKTSMLMLATSLAVEINRENMSVKELEAIKRWGSILLKEHTNVENLSFDLEKSWGADSRSHVAAGYISLGISTKNKDMLNLGLDLLSYVLENDIDENGMYSNHWENHTHLGMEHQNVITAQLVNSAHILKNNGFDIYYLKNKKGSTLADAINFTIENAFENNSPKIKNLEVTRPYLDATRKVFNTLSWLELAGADNPEYLENLSFMNALEFRDTTATFVTESIAGFFGGNMPGYTSCYFSIKAPKVDVANKIKMMTFYQNTSFNQRQCLFKLFSPDLLVLFKSNDTLPTKRLEERRIEGYLSCRNR